MSTMTLIDCERARVDDQRGRGETFEGAARVHVYDTCVVTSAEEDTRGR